MAEAETELTRETFDTLVRDSGSAYELLYAMYRKLVELRQDVDALNKRVLAWDAQESLVDSWVKEALAFNPPEEVRAEEEAKAVETDETEQMLGNESASHDWYLLHERCWSWPQVRKLRTDIVQGFLKHGVFGGQTQESVENSVASAIRNNAEFADYRRAVWEASGDPQRGVLGLDPWSFLEGLEELAGPADDSSYVNRAVELYLKAQPRLMKARRLKG